MGAISAVGGIVDQQSELCGRVKQFLEAQHFNSFRKIDVQASGDSVVLKGSMPSFHERQLALACCHRVAGVRGVVDELLVRSPAKALLPNLIRGRVRPK